MEQTAAHQIQQRIIWLIVRAFIGVVLVTVLVVMVITGISLSNSLAIPPFNQLPVVARLEGYYLGHGNWQGVEPILRAETRLVGENPTLLDANNQIVIDHGQSESPNRGKLYQPAAREINLDLTLNGERVGRLVLDRQSLGPGLVAMVPILAPIGLISIFLALLAVLVVALLSRRVVTPLAEVIAASHAVTAGKLETRVQVQGPQDLLVLTESFNQMAASLERSDRERRDLLADIAHELRTPLSAIRGRLEGMLDGIYPADEKHLSLALKANYLLERLVEDLRLLTLAESRQLDFERKETDLSTLAAHIVELFSAEADEKGITLELLPAPGPFLALVDPQRTEQVIGNLVGNALRYVPTGGKIWLTLEQTESVVCLSVSDNGPGIPPDDLPYIFERFWRKDKSRSRHSGGSGLGLSISKQFVEAQGGTISAVNLSGGGLKMLLNFPVKKLS